MLFRSLKPHLQKVSCRLGPALGPALGTALFQTIGSGLSPDEARSRIWLIDRAGLVTDDMEDLPDYQQAYARPASEVADWAREHGAIGLLETVRRVHPTILIGTSTDHGAFTREVIEEMSSGVERPIVLPLSNPTERIEAMPADVVA